MARRKKQSPAEQALGKIPAEVPIRRTVAKDDGDVWPEILMTIVEQSRALLFKHRQKIERAHKDSKNVDEPQSTYRVNLTAVINDEDPDNYDVNVKIAYPSAMREAFSAKTKDDAKGLIATSPDLVDQMDD